MVHLLSNEKYIEGSRGRSRGDVGGLHSPLRGQSCQSWGPLPKLSRQPESSTEVWLSTRGHIAVVGAAF